MTMPLHGMEIERERKSIIVQLPSLSALQITCAGEEKRNDHGCEPQLLSKTMVDRKGNKPRWEFLEEMQS